VAPTAQKWNDAHPTEKVTVKEQTTDANQQHDDIVQHMQAKDTSYDVITVDVVWTAEFAAKGWLVPLKGEYAIDYGGMMAAATLVLLPQLILYTIFQRQVIGGRTVGAVKG